MATAPAPIVLAVTDGADRLAFVNASDLIDALQIAVDQLDVTHDEDANGYGIDTAEDALAIRDRLLDVLNAVNGAM